MATTYHLIRHGRASAEAADYDQLHALGEQQAQLLGRALAGRAQRFDEVFVGPMRRHRDTWRLMYQAAVETGRGEPWPDAQFVDGLAEAPFDVLLKAHVLPRLPTDRVLQKLMREIRQAQDPVATRAAMRRSFAYMLELWREGKIGDDTVEREAAFRARVLAAFDAIRRAPASGMQVGVVTSHGVIACIVEHHLGPEHGDAMAMLANTSVTTLRETPTGLELTSHNVTDHLVDPVHLTLI